MPEPLSRRLIGEPATTIRNLESEHAVHLPTLPKRQLFSFSKWRCSSALSRLRDRLRVRRRLGRKGAQSLLETSSAVGFQVAVRPRPFEPDGVGEAWCMLVGDEIREGGIRPYQNPPCGHQLLAARERAS